MRKNMLNKLHEGHLGIDKTQKLARDYILARNQCTDYIISKCSACLESKRSNTKEPMAESETPELPWMTSNSKRDYELFIGSWNCNGWYLSQSSNDSRILRKCIINSLNCDIVGLCETHLKDEEQIDLSGYCWIGSNRRNISANAWRGSGGFGFLMKEKLLESFHAHILDNNRDDILWIQLTSKYDSEHILYFCVCYLQPKRLSRGNLAQDFMTVYYLKCIYIATETQFSFVVILTAE
ncbi:unnamed protein product [Mytilus coruscus]|uniref:Uncharacterized protein n=1 Tax=Mytilus coruscus TaxID=42192 RepID=A0A6J8AFW5_MYTCO|nr:unnamed protein product [Mytilus coruscus]